MADLLVGVDAGGSTTRCAVAGADGTVLGRAVVGGANQRSGGSDPPAILTESLRAALGDLDPGRVAAGVFGIPGAEAAGRAAAQGMADSAWRSTGIGGRPAVVTDIAVAFAAGSTADEGVVLLAGTTAVAAALRGTRIAARCDGYGWLLGDEGSAVWLGREAVRAALAAMDGRGRPTTLTTQVARTLLSREAGPDGSSPAQPRAHSETRARPQEDAGALAQALVTVVYERPPTQLGMLAPMVSRAATAGDEVAQALVADAARRLLAAVDAVRSHLPGGSPTVVAGSVLADGPVAEAVGAGLAERGLQPVPAGEGELGALSLALRRLDTDPERVAAAHDRLAATLPHADL